MILPFVIRKRLGPGSRIVHQASAGYLLARRTLLQMVSGPSGNAHVIFILGCQRSGTTMLSKIFEGDARVSPFAEHSGQLSRDNHPIRMRHLEDVRAVFERSKGHLIVSKPLVESQRATELLSFFDRARAVWMFRDYRDVVKSYVRLFDVAGVNIMRKIIDRADNWASEGVSDITHDTIARLYREDISREDAAALFWWARNRLFFELDLKNHPRVMLCQYETLVSEPGKTMETIYDFAAVSYPGPHLVGGVHALSKGLGRALLLSPEVENLCSALHERLITVQRESE